MTNNIWSQPEKDGFQFQESGLWSSSLFIRDQICNLYQISLKLHKEFLCYCTQYANVIENELMILGYTIWFGPCHINCPVLVHVVFCDMLMAELGG